MRWEDIDMRTLTWRIPMTKSGDPVSIHLSAPASRSCVVARRIGPGRGCSWPRCVRSPAGTESGLEADLLQAGSQDLRIHDLRRTLGSWQAATGASLPIIGKTLGHKTAQATSVYARLDIDPVRQAVDVAVTAMLGTIKTTNQEGGQDDGEE
ncbi:MAG: hypothetical protein U0935_05830 [Pirellulales bacterium]